MHSPIYDYSFKYCWLYTSVNEIFPYWLEWHGESFELFFHEVMGFSPCNDNFIILLLFGTWDFFENKLLLL